MLNWRIRLFYLMYVEVAVRRTDLNDVLKASVCTERATCHMFNLSGHILIKGRLIFGQHLQHQTQVYPPLYFRHSVSAGHQTQLYTHYTSLNSRRFTELYCKDYYFTHLKSVWSFSSVTGLKDRTFFWRPITQAVSGVLANTRPDDTHGFINYKKH